MNVGKILHNNRAVYDQAEYEKVLKQHRDTLEEVPYSTHTHTPYRGTKQTRCHVQREHDWVHIQVKSILRDINRGDAHAQMAAARKAWEMACRPQLHALFPASFLPALVSLMVGLAAQRTTVSSFAFADGHKQYLDRPMGVTRTFASPLRLRLPSLPFTLPIK